MMERIKVGFRAAAAKQHDNFAGADIERCAMNDDCSAGTTLPIRESLL
jgi:hypothetical protein